MNTLKKSMLLLLLACLCACGREENLAAQNKPKQKTIKEALCREWHLDNLQNTDFYTKKDTFGIIFYPNHTFIFRIDPKIQQGLGYIKGTWKFRNLWEENYLCNNDSEEVCTYNTQLQLLSDINIENTGYCYDMFEIGKFSSLIYLNSNTLWLKPPESKLISSDRRYFSFLTKQ